MMDCRKKVRPGQEHDHLYAPAYVTVEEYARKYPKEDIKVDERVSGFVKVAQCKICCDFTTRITPKKQSGTASQKRAFLREQRLRRGY